MNIFICFQDILKDAIESNVTSATMIPYFEGDFWPNMLEESIKELDQEEEEKRKREEAEAAAAEQEPECIDDGEGSNQVTLTLEMAPTGFFYNGVSYKSQRN